MSKIPPSVIKKLRNAFEKKKGPALDQVVANNPESEWDKDARYSVYSIEEIQNYLSSLKNVTHVKVCLGQYEKETCPPNHLNYAGLTTLIFVPIKGKGLEEQSEGEMIMSSSENFDDPSDDEGLNRGGTGIPPGGQ